MFAKGPHFQPDLGAKGRKEKDTPAMAFGFPVMLTIMGGCKSERQEIRSGHVLYDARDQTL